MKQHSKSLFRSLASAAVLTCIFAHTASAQVPLNMSFQGELGPGIGANSTQNITFKIYNVATGGTALWSETQSVKLNNRVFNVVLGSSTPLDLPFDEQYYLGIKVGNGTEMTPRVVLTSAPYSHRSRIADSAGTVADNSITSAKIVDGQVMAADLADGSVTTPKLANSAVTSAKIGDGEVATADLANGSVTLPKISATGAAGNQSIMFDGSNIVWGNPAADSLVMPYAHTQNSASTLFAVTNTGAGGAGRFAISNGSNTSSAMTVATSGIGSGVTVQLTNASNGARGIDVLQAGVGPGVFATSAGGNAVWGITSSISAAGVIGDNTFGEAVVGRNRGGNGVGAVVGRNDSSGYGVRGFNTKDGIGVLGQAGISGGTGVGGRFENVNAANGNDALQAATNGTGWAGNFTNANNSSAAKGIRISTTAGQGGNALTVANGTVSLSYQHPYASNTVVDDAILVVTTAGNVTVPTGAPLDDGATVWVVNNSGGAVTITNTTAGGIAVATGRAQQLLFVSTISGANWVPVQ